MMGLSLQMVGLLKVQKGALYMKSKLGTAFLLIALLALAYVLFSPQSSNQVASPTIVEPETILPPSSAGKMAANSDEALPKEDVSQALLGTLIEDERTALEREFDETSDYYSFVNAHSESALSGNGQASYLIYRAREFCRLFMTSRRNADGGFRSKDEVLGLSPSASAFIVDETETGYQRCEGFFDEAEMNPDSFDVAREEVQSWLLLASEQGYPAAVIFASRSSWETWLGSPDESAVLKRVASAIASGRPDALWQASTFFDDPEAWASILAACQKGYPCSMEHGIFAEDCKWEREACVPGETVAEHLKRTLPPYQYDEIVSAYRRIESASEDEFVVLLKAGVDGWVGIEQE